MNERVVARVAALAFWMWAFLPLASAQGFVIKPVAEKKVQQLPPGPLYWRVESFPALAAAQAGAGATSLAAKVAEIGPVPPVVATEYLLRINSTGGPPGVKTSVHTHPGSEAFYVLTGRLGQKTPDGVSHAEAGSAMNGHDAGTPMEVFSSGTSDLTALVMFVVDAAKPFSSPAKLP
jgi:hypothetical protein